MTTSKLLAQGYHSRKLAQNVFAGDGILQIGTLAIDAVPEKFKTTTALYWRRNGIQFTKAATTAIVFTAAHPVSSSKFGVILIQINDAGTISTKITGATQTTAMAYNSAAEALAAKPAADAGNIAIGYVAIAAKAALWTANTDDMTAASDLTTATFVDGTALPFTA